MTTRVGLGGVVVVVMMAAVVAAASSSCKPDPTGAVMLVIDSDHVPGVDFDRFEIQVTSSTSKDKYENVIKEFGRPGLVTFPLVLPLVSNGDPSTSLHIRIITGSVAGAAGDGGGGGAVQTAVGAPRNLREIVTTVPKARVVLLHATLDWLCVGASKPEEDGYVEGSCPEGLTCIAGQCVDWTIKSETLPDYSEAAVFGGGSRSGQGGQCFDTKSCFEQGAVEKNVDLSDCTVEAPSAVGDNAGTGVNVALVLAPNQGGICAGGACLIPLTLDAPEGFRIEGGRLVLPRAACDHLAEKPPAVRTVIGIATTAACATKTTQTPTCGLWSPFGEKTTEATAPSGYVAPPDASVSPTGDAGKDAGKDAR